LPSNFSVIPTYSIQIVVYPILRQWVRAILKIFVGRAVIQGKKNLPASGPVLLIANHPNSFLDAILLACYLDRPIWSLARGDAFRKPLAKKILSKLFMIPIYRLSEGKEYLGENDQTFQRCLELFRKGEVVLIFGEGICLHQTKILPMKKGAARLAKSAWDEDIPLQVVPIALKYGSFHRVPLLVSIQLGEYWHKASHQWDESSEGSFIKSFNLKSFDTLQELYRSLMVPTSSSFFSSVLWYFFMPLLLLIQVVARKLTRGTVFFQSVFLAILVFSAPLYLFLVGGIFWILLF